MNKQFLTREDVWDYWRELEYEVAYTLWNQFLENPTEPQRWTLIKAPLLQRIVRSAYAGTLNEKARQIIDDFQDKIFWNYCQLEFNTILCGHSTEDPIEYLEDKDITATQAQLEAFWDTVDDPVTGQSWISDYGLKPIAQLIAPMYLQQNYSLKVQIITEILGITHMRGDLAAMFVQMGSKALLHVNEYESASY